MNKTQVTKTSRKDCNHNTIIDCKNVFFGEGYFTVIAGPCAIENLEMALQTAKELKINGVKVMRCSIFKPRTSPYSYQGYGKAGTEIIDAIKNETGLLVESEVLSFDHLNILYDHIDLIRIGSRNMDNYELLKEIGKICKPVILKRGMSATLKEFLSAAEYIMSAGNENIILCERGIRSFETYTRNTLDILAIPALKELTHLPVIVDPSHSSGKSSLVSSASKAAIAAGADGLLVEVHPDPSKALSDGAQSLDFNTFKILLDQLKKLSDVFDKEY
ncbi:MAG: 3-deoxy-7-phosphoheptulonate synthase [Ignavibacteriaceae bacterium]